MMITAGGHATRAASAPAGGDSPPTPEQAAGRGEKSTEAQTAASRDTAGPESSQQRLAPDLIKIAAYTEPEVMAQSAHSPEGRIGFPLLAETAPHGLTYAAVEKAISDQLTGQAAAHGPKLTVRQALILSCGLMTREARSSGVESRGKYEKLDLYRPLAETSRSVSAPPVSQRTY
jgi:hypothetical protein